MHSRKSEHWSLLLIRAIIPLKGSILVTVSKPTQLPKPSPLNTITLGTGSFTFEPGGVDTDIQDVTTLRSAGSLEDSQMLNEAPCSGSLLECS